MPVIPKCRGTAAVLGGRDCQNGVADGHPTGRCGFCRVMFCERCYGYKRPRMKRYPCPEWQTELCAGCNVDDLFSGAAAARAAEQPSRNQKARRAKVGGMIDAAFRLGRDGLIELERRASSAT